MLLSEGEVSSGREREMGVHYGNKGSLCGPADVCGRAPYLILVCGVPPVLKHSALHTTAGNG